MSKARLPQSAVIALLVLGMSGPAWAQGGNQGSTPNGKPFQALQGQADDLQSQINQLNSNLLATQAQIAAIDARVTAITSGLQADLTNIFSRLAALEGRADGVDAQLGQITSRIDTLEQATALLEGKVTANQEAIVALNNANAELSAELQSANYNLSNAIGNLYNQLYAIQNNLQQQINSNTSNIQSLGYQTNQLQQFINNMANSSCVAGQAVRDISPTGVLLCSNTIGGNLSSIYLSGYFYVGGGGQGYANPACPAGYTVTGGGTSLWPLTDYSLVATTYEVNYPYLQSYWNGYGYGYTYYLYHNVSTYSRQAFVPFNSAWITQDYPSYNTYVIAAQSRSGYYNPTNYVAWSVSCTRLQ